MDLILIFFHAYRFFSIKFAHFTRDMRLDDRSRIKIGRLVSGAGTVNATCQGEPPGSQSWPVATLHTAGSLVHTSYGWHAPAQHYQQQRYRRQRYSEQCVTCEQSGERRLATRTHRALHHRQPHRSRGHRQCRQHRPPSGSGHA